MFISIKFTETSINKTNKIHQKVIGSKFMFKMSTIYTNTCTQTTMPLHSRHCNDGMVQHTFLQLIMDLRTVDTLLNDIPDAVVHQLQIRQIGWRHLLEINSGVSLCSKVKCLSSSVNGMI